MSALTPVKGDKSFIVALGPFKMEVIYLATASNDDTVVSKLASPSFACMFPAADAGSTTQNCSATVSGKTVTLRDPAGAIAHVVLVFGDSVWS